MNAAEAFGQYLALIQDNIGLFDKEPDLLAALRDDAIGSLPDR